MRMLTRLLLSAAAVALLGGAPLSRADQSHGGKRSDHSAHVGAELLQAAGRSLLRRRHRHRHQFERARLRLSPQRRYAAVRVRPERHLRQGMGRRPLRHRVRAPGARRSAGQRLGRGRGDEHGHQVQPRGTRRDGARPQAGAGRRRDADSERAEPARCSNKKYRFRPADRCRRGMRRATSSSPTATSTRASVKYDKNGRFVAQFAGETRRRAEPAQHAAFDRVGRAGQHLRRRSRQPPHRRPEQRHDAQDACTRTSATRGRSASRPGRISTCISSNSNPDSNTPASSWDITGEIYKMELDGKIIGKFGKAGKGLGEFSTVHEIDCRNPDQLFVSEISAWRAQKIILSPSKMQPATSSAAAR